MSEQKFSRFNRASDAALVTAVADYVKSALEHANGYGFNEDWQQMPAVTHKLMFACLALSILSDRGHRKADIAVMLKVMRFQVDRAQWQKLMGIYTAIEAGELRDGLNKLFAQILLVSV